MNHYLKKICVMVLAAVMAASGPQFVFAASSGKDGINIEETQAYNSRFDLYFQKFYPSLKAM